MSRIYDYVVYHKNCVDGFCGLFILTLTNNIDPDAVIFADVPSADSAPRDIENKNIIIIDVAYNKKVMTEFIKKSKRITLIDHHISVRDDMLNLKFRKHDEIVYDVDKCGSSLTWKYFFKDKKMPQFIKYIEDNDIGRWSLKDTTFFLSGLNVNYPLVYTNENIARWKKLFSNNEVESLIKKGKTYSEYQNYLIKHNVGRHHTTNFPSKLVYNSYKNFFKKIGQYKVVVFNGHGCPSSNLIANRIFEQTDCDFIIFWIYNFSKKTYLLQFRSHAVDVSKIAKLFGGGGHTLAAACSISKDIYDIYDLFIDITE